jgi:hypothetical protein
MTAPYAVRALTFTFQLGTGNFGSSGSNQLVLTGLRATVHVKFAVAPTTGEAQMHIFGMTLSQMNQLSKAGLVYKTRNNAVAIQAGDSISGMTTVFNGIILEAYPDMAAMPETSFFVKANPASIIQMAPIAPNSFTGGTSAATALSQIAKGAGLTLENNGGVKTQLASPYFAGTAWDQMLSCARAADCFAYLDGINKVLAIWPKNGNRGGDSTTISPANGMIGYPSFSANQVIVRTLFNTAVQAGQPVQIQSQLQAANGTFTVYDVVHELSSQMPDGPWETIITTSPDNT